MKKLFSTLLIAAALMVGCTPDGPDDGGATAGYNTKVNATAVAGTTWEEGDKIGLFTDSDFNIEYTLVEGAGTEEGVFDGKMSKDALVLGAYAPYSEAAGGNLSAINVAIPATVKHGETPVYEFAAGVADDSGKLTFHEKLARLNVSFENLAGSFAEGKEILSLSITADLPFVGAFKNDITDATAEMLAADAGSEKVLTFEFAEGTTLSNDLVLKAGVAPVIKQGWNLAISVRFSDITVDAKVVSPSGMAFDEDYNLVLDANTLAPTVDLLWAYNIGGYSIKGNVPAIDDNGNVYINSGADNNVYKINADGTLGWKVAPGYEGGTSSTVSVEADGSAIYAAGGVQTANTGLYVLNSDGSVKGSFLNEKFYNKGSTPNVGINAHTCPSYDATHLYIGNGKSAGTAISINKADLSRIAYVSGNADGTGSPAGGCGSNIAISKSGTVAFNSGSYGLFLVDKGEFDNPTNENTTPGFGKYVHFIYKIFHNNSNKWTCGGQTGVACGAIDGVEHYFYAAQEETSSTTFVAAVKADGSTNQPTYVHLLPAGTQKQDQGGLIIGAQGEAIMSLKNNGTVSGGLYAVSTNGKLAWRYESGTHVSGAAALDAAGNVHFADEAGNYYIVAPDYTNQTAREVVKVRIADLLKNNGYEVEGSNAKSWTSVMIGKDGKVYLATNAGDKNDNAYVLCMTYYTCTGAGTSSWPMKFGNQYHSGVAK